MNWKDIKLHNIIRIRITSFLDDEQKLFDNEEIFYCLVEGITDKKFHFRDICGTSKLESEWELSFTYLESGTSTNVSGKVYKYEILEIIDLQNNLKMDYPEKFV